MTVTTCTTRTTTKTSLVTDTTDMARNDEQATNSGTHDSQRLDVQPQPCAETQTAYLPRTALGAIAVNWK